MRLQVWDVNPLGIGEQALYLHSDCSHAGDGCLSEPLTHQACEQHPLSKLHVQVAACERVGHIKALRAEGVGIPVDGFLLQVEAAELASELEVADHHCPQGHVLTQQGAGGACALHRRDRADAVVVDQGQIDAGARGCQCCACWSRDLDAQCFRAFIEAVVEKAEGQINTGSAGRNDDAGGKWRSQVGVGGEVGSRQKTDRNHELDRCGTGAADAYPGTIAILRGDGVDGLDCDLRLSHRHGQADREIVDRQSVVVASVVGLDPAQPECGAGRPGGDGEVKVSPTPSHTPGAVSIHRPGCGRGHRGGPVEVAARCHPGGHLIKVCAIAVFQDHRLGGGVSAVAPLLAVEGDVEAADGAATGIAER